ncbi:peptidoglycan-binding protein, partial [Roseateles sp. GG27B]
VNVYVPDRKFTFSSGYRCSVDNTQHQRNTTNHHGKAVDLDFEQKPGEDKKDDMVVCDAVRGTLGATANAQIKWLTPNRKALEPGDIAPTWVHYDVRCYDARYLTDDAFCTSNETLNARQPINC